MDQLEEAHKKGIVLGLRGVSGVAQRVDIDVMLTEQPDTFNLFLIALMELQGMENLPWQNDIPDGFSFKPGGNKLDMKMSWFQLAGIHGLPERAWDSEGQDGWYCTHSQPNFGTWHRPYLAMMEQTLFRQVANVAKRFSESPQVSATDKEKYLAAAKQFRLPYFDYYRPRGDKVTFPGVIDNGKTTAPYDWSAPQIFTMREIMVKRLPDNKLVPMANPFCQFKFKGEDHASFGKNPTGLVALEATIRHGGSNEASTKSLNEKLNSVREDQLRQCLAMIEDKVYRNFRAFSSNAVVLNPNEQAKEVLGRASGSIEDFHGGYHVYIGGFNGNTPVGHMSSISVAAFDPIFWIHHCQIDRVFAIWQAANGETHWFNELDSARQKMGNDNLMPFRKWPLADKTDTKNRYWTSDRARDTATFGYTYPETANGKSGDKIREEFGNRYRWSLRTTAKPSFGTPPDDMRPLPVAKAQVFQYTSDVPSQSLLKTPGASMRVMQQQTVMSAMTVTAATPEYSDEWYIDVVVERMLANGSYTIFYIIGDVSGQTGQEWSSLPGFVGVSHILAAPREVCINCQRQDEEAQLVTSTTPITSQLLDYHQTGQLSSMEADDVKKFLIEKLKWRVQTLSGAVLDPRNMSRDHRFNLSISRKRTPVSGTADDVQYDTFPDVIEAIIRNSS